MRIVKKKNGDSMVHESRDAVQLRVIWYVCHTYTQTHAANAFINFRNSSGFRMFLHNIPHSIFIYSSLFCRNHEMLSNTFQPTAQFPTMQPPK